MPQAVEVDVRQPAAFVGRGLNRRAVTLWRSRGSPISEAKMSLRLEVKVTVVTATSRELGRLVANELARERAQVVISSCDEETLRITATEIREYTGAEVAYFPADLAKEEDIRGLVSQAVERFGVQTSLSTASVARRRI